MIELITTAESVEQAKALIQADIDMLYIGEKEFGLRLPTTFSREELIEMTTYAHEHGKKVRVAVNAIMHNNRIKSVIPYLEFLQEIEVDSITVGDPGVIHLMKKNALHLPYVFDAQTLVTSARQINFWVKRGAISAVLAREIPYLELKELASGVSVPLEILVYGATCIHQSKRPLVKNYFGFVGSDVSTKRQRGLFISEPKNKDTHYSIYEDNHGTHIFANNDINLLDELQVLNDLGVTEWKLDGIYTKGQDFISIAKIFVKAKTAIENEEWNEAMLEELNKQLLSFHPGERGLDKGFYEKDPSEIQ
ncbi:peptidase U32 family protein [Oceanobacillus bengalensis]|uniref:U32 family peptidase n=1 Tax=Oceanobacillus bengalensis TaxID=1435466 RepID=A0A494Z2H0_9BACI|nr:peptidase U32 family protein [Oceanobacillus bengalensis]RKQ16601.1 U32 family peptidase [Oceanobacillus bengalensis]